MAITLNVNNSLKTPTAITVNVNGTLHNVKEVWCNAGGTLKFVWPGSHTAYNGSTFSGALSGGLVSGLNVYVYHYVSPSVGYNSVTYKLYHKYFDGYVDNYNLTSGSAVIGLTDSGSNGYIRYIGYRSKDLINWDSYKQLKITMTFVDSSFASNGLEPLYVSFPNSASNNVVGLNQDIGGTTGTFTFDVSSISGQRYLVMEVRATTDSTHNNYSKYWNAKIDKIEFVA